MSTVTYRVEPKENIYFAIALAISLVIYTLIIVGLVAAVDMGKSEILPILAFYAIFILVLLHLMRGMLVGLIRGNAVKLGPHQFADIHAIVMKQAQQLGLGRIPDVYLLQQGGSLNAFATRFMGADYIVLFSDIMDEAYEQNIETVEFVIAHELGHVKRNHILKRLIVLPAMFIPFFGYAYSRACEYTCDSIGASLSEKGARSGLLVLAAGTKLFRKVNIQQFVEQRQTESGFWFWFSEKLSTHPHLVKRLARYPDDSQATLRSKSMTAQQWSVPVSKPVEEVAASPAAPVEEKADDLSRFMPR
jgi:Zn-dependent protease with chaperone function